MNLKITYLLQFHGPRYEVNSRWIVYDRDQHADPMATADAPSDQDTREDAIEAAMEYAEAESQKWRAHLPANRVRSMPLTRVVTAQPCGENEDR